MKVLFTFCTLFLFYFSFGQKITTVIYKQEIHYSQQSITLDGKKDSNNTLDTMRNLIANILSNNLIFTRTYVHSNDTIYLSVIHSPQKNNRSITVDIDSKSSYRIFYRGKFYIKENGKYIYDKVHNKIKSHLISTGRIIKFSNYSCEIFTDNGGKNIYYITQSLKQNINPLFLQFDNLNGAIVYAKQFNDNDTGSYMILIATSTKY